MWRRHSLDIQPFSCCCDLNDGTTMASLGLTFEVILPQLGVTNVVTAGGRFPGARDRPGWSGPRGQSGTQPVSTNETPIKHTTGD